jgi:hypothetical protein
LERTDWDGSRDWEWRRRRSRVLGVWVFGSRDDCTVTIRLVLSISLVDLAALEKVDIVGGLESTIVSGIER